MSPLTIVRPRAPVTDAIRSLLCHRPSPSLPLSPSPPQQQQLRWHWRVVLPSVWDPETGRYKFDSWRNHLRNFRQPLLGDGTSMLRRELRNTRHMKRWMMKQKSREKREYKRKMQKVEDLQSYIKLLKDRKSE